MSHYPVYLEIADDGRCMAHVLDLPGCVVRAPARDEALSQLPGAIRDYHVWLRRHGELAPPVDEPIEVEVAGESSGIGPFDRRSAAALFLPEQQPITLDEMERYFYLMGYNRADLLALVRDLPDDVLDWQPHPESFTIRGLLRHVGNAEKWYVSRLVDLEGLSPEWSHDESLPILEFLEMTRRTAIGQLQHLTQAERSGVFYTAHRAWEPGEPWTARKVLRRFLEHEQEHTNQVREILAAWRRHLLARLTTGRARLLEQVIGLDEKTIIGSAVVGDWTAKDLLAHIATWDRWALQEMQRMLSGGSPDLTTARDEDAFNAAAVTAWRNRSLDEVLAELQAARASWVAWLEDLPEETFSQRRLFEEDDWSFPGWLEVYWRHDAEHAAQLATWREKVNRQEGSG
jgi:predicted RNase H-like HicB family nuclease/uncharacterized damage-inducible protein DinB